MELSDKVEVFGEKYLAPFLTGLGYLAFYATATRLKEEKYLDPTTRLEEPLFQRAIYPYALGEAGSQASFPVLMLFGIDSLFRGDDPRLLGASLGALLLGNITSLLYELFRDEE